MKMSVSLPDEDADFLDNYAAEHHQSRSAALHEAINLLRLRGLSADYADAFTEFSASGDADAWDAATADGAA